MPHFWNNTNLVAVTTDEVVPKFWSSKEVLSVELSRWRKKEYGIKKLQRGGGFKKELLLNFDTLPNEIKEALGDPRKMEHNLLYYYRTDAGAIEFFTTFKRPDGMYLKPEEQERYITNASVLKAIIELRQKYTSEKIRLGSSIKGTITYLCEESNSFNEILYKKYELKHTLPTHPTRFKECLYEFESGDIRTKNYLSLIKDVEGKRKSNPIKVNDITLIILNGLFENQKHKPTATEIYRSYDAFLNGYAEVFNEDTGELFNPKEFKKLSERTVKLYLSKWENSIATHKKRSGDRQKYIANYMPHAQTEKPKYAGSLLSIDDRNPPFLYDGNNRVWFYIGLDVASNCFTTFVYGKSKEGIILEFYRQMVRDYAHYGFGLPDGLECESALNSSFKDTLLKEGVMFQNIRIEANNAQGKIIERQFGNLRYSYEKEQDGWQARPFAKSESNQKGKQSLKELPYKTIIEHTLKGIEQHNNTAHDTDKTKSRWEYFCEMQHPDLKPINYNAILPHLGYYQQSSCNRGFIQLQGKLRAIAENGAICMSDTLIQKMKMIEGKDIDIYWIDDNEGNVLKALAYYENQLICEVMEMPKFNRAVNEQTEQCKKNMALQMEYKMSVESFVKSQTQKLQPISIINNQPKTLNNKFQIRGVKRYEVKEIDDAKILGTTGGFNEDYEYENAQIETSNISWKKSFLK